MNDELSPALTVDRVMAPAHLRTRPRYSVDHGRTARLAYREPLG